MTKKSVRRFNFTYVCWAAGARLASWLDLDFEPESLVLGPCSDEVPQTRLGESCAW